MKRSWIQLIILGAAVGLLGACGSSQTASTPEEKAEAATAQKVKAEDNSIELSAEAARSQALRVVNIGRRRISESKVFPASIEEAANRSSTVSAPVAGRVQQVNADIGSRVATGQVMAVLASTELGTAKAGLLAAKADLLAARSRQIAARQQSQRESYLAGRGISSQREKQEAQAQLASAEAEYAGAQTEIEAAEARLLALGMTTGEVSKLGRGADITPRLYARSPMSGLVLKRGARIGQVVQPGEALFTISDLSEVWVVLKVFQSDIGRLQVGDRVRFKLNNQGKQTVSGKVVLVSEILDPQTRAADVRVVIPNRERLLKPGMLVQAEVDLGGSSREVLAVPEQAIYEIRGKQVVFVRETTTRFSARPIQTGTRLGQYVEVTSGLKPRDPVVVEGGFVLKAELLKS